MVAANSGGGGGGGGSGSLLLEQAASSTATDTAVSPRGRANSAWRSARRGAVRRALARGRRVEG
jgi:hypothetical protein